MNFELYSDYSPAGDQPQAIEKLVDGLTAGLAHQTEHNGTTFDVNLFGRQKSCTFCTHLAEVFGQPWQVVIHTAHQVVGICIWVKCEAKTI